MLQFAFVGIAGGTGGNRITMPASLSASALETYNSPFLTSVSASISFRRNGEIQTTDQTGTTTVGYWCANPSATVGDGFYVKFDYSGDALESGSPADNSYVQLNSDRTFTQTQSGGVGSDSTTGTFSVALDGSGAGAQSCSATISAELT